MAHDGLQVDARIDTPEVEEGPELSGVHDFALEQSTDRFLRKTLRSTTMVSIAPFSWLREMRNVEMALFRLENPGAEPQRIL